MTSFHEDRKDKDEYIEEERKRRQPEGSTFHQFANADAETDRGRFTVTEKSTVVGAKAVPEYPRPPTGPWSGEDLVGTEPPTGYEIDAVEPLLPPTETCAVGTGGAVDEPSGLPPLTDVERAAPPSSSRGKDDDPA
jgi:hypothetical protein